MRSLRKVFHPHHQPSQLFGWEFAWLRWVTVAAMLLITVIWPVAGRHAIPIWVWLLVFAAYNFTVELIRWRLPQWQLPRLRAFAWIPLMDFVVVGTLYYLDYEPGGPIFVLFYLAIVCAAITMSLRGTLLYTVAVVALVAVVAPTLPGWSPTPLELRQLSARLVVFALVGIGANVVTRRLVQEQEAAHALRTEAERFQELDRIRGDFVASVSHELRTPLTATRAGLGMLETSAYAQLRPDQQQLLGNARRNIERLTWLIDDLLTFNQLEAGVLQLDREPLDLRVVISDVVAGMHSLLREKHQPLELDLPAPLPSVGDARRLGQVVLNILANAHRHTPAGTRITVAAQIVAHEVRLTVHDTGPGIPPGDLEAIFRRFYRLTPSEDGSGLGLAIAKALTELHGGRIWAESQPGNGATFHIALPYQPAQRS